MQNIGVERPLNVFVFSPKYPVKCSINFKIFKKKYTFDFNSNLAIYKYTNEKYIKP